jgi:hypothetical protein
MSLAITIFVMLATRTGFFHVMAAFFCLAAMFAVLTDGVLQFIFGVMNPPFAFCFAIMFVSKRLRGGGRTHA